jgi:ketosteroid isomerase-like protein
MPSRNIESHRAGHEAFNQRDFEAMTRHYADTISWTDHSQGRTFRTPQEFRDDFLAGWVAASTDIQVTDARYLDAGQTTVCTFTVAGTQDGPLGRSPPPARSSRCRSASCGTSTPAGGWSAGTSTTTRSRCSPSWA